MCSFDLWGFQGHPGPANAFSSPVKVFCMFRKGIFPLSRRWILEGSSPIVWRFEPKVPPKMRGWHQLWVNWSPSSEIGLTWIFFKHNFRMCTLRKKLSGTRYGRFSAKIQRFIKKVTKISRWGVPTYLESVTVTVKVKKNLYSRLVFYLRAPTAAGALLWIRCSPSYSSSPRTRLNVFS